MLFVRRLYLPFLLLLCALWTFIPIEGGDDFWAHAAIGRIVLDTGHIPRATVYLWSADVPWVFHAYGSGIIYALLLRLGGPYLALCLNFALAAVPLILVWRHAKYRAGEVPLLLVGLLVPALWFCSVRWRLRPEGFSVLFFTLVLLFLAQEKRKNWQYVAVAGMFALWPNLHGGVLVGIMILWAAVVAQALTPLIEKAVQWPRQMLGLLWGSFVKSSPKTDSERFFRPAFGEEKTSSWAGPRFDAPLLALAALCSVLPLLCNPWGFGYRTVFAGTAATSNHIAEWRHFWTYPIMNREIAWGLCALLVFTFLLWCLDRQKRAALGAALLILGALWLQARRQMWLASITCMVALAQSAMLLNGERLYRMLKRQKDARLDAPMKNIAQVGMLLILMSACAANTPRHIRPAVGTTAPVAMSQFLITKAPKGRIFNDYEYSAALEWFLGGKRLLYIDLINAYPPELFDGWFDVAHARPAGLKTLDTKKVDLVALRPLTNKDKDDVIYSLTQYMGKSKAWKQIYSGEDGHVWMRRKPFGVVEEVGPDMRPLKTKR